MAKPPKRKPAKMIAVGDRPVATDMAKLVAIAPMVVASSTVRRLSRSESAPIGNCMTAPPAMKALISQAISAIVKPWSSNATGATVRNVLLTRPTEKTPMVPSGETAISRPRRSRGVCRGAGRVERVIASGTRQQQKRMATSEKSSKPRGSARVRTSWPSVTQARSTSR